ncbi:glycoside hydrolase domain-containing protein [Pedobacter cryoconitis]|uniref:glycoside hydrolase domain-containing protein n=1 Tax=Pedobacter cryoconitis TaxID=188932 RepID=UPI003B58A6D1
MSNICLNFSVPNPGHFRCFVIKINTLSLGKYSFEDHVQINSGKISNKSYLWHCSTFKYQFRNCSGQQLHYKIGTNSWNPDSLGNHRAVITISTASAVAKTVIEWRRKDDCPGKLG